MLLALAFFPRRGQHCPDRAEMHGFPTSFCSWFLSVGRVSIHHLVFIHIQLLLLLALASCDSSCLSGCLYVRSKGQALEQLAHRLGCRTPGGDCAGLAWESRPEACPGVP